MPYRVLSSSKKDTGLVTWDVSIKLNQIDATRLAEHLLEVTERSVIVVKEVSALEPKTREVS